MVLTLHLWFTAGFGFATLVLGFRLLAKSRTWFFFEMALIALSTAVIFFLINIRL